MPSQDRQVQKVEIVNLKQSQHQSFAKKRRQKITSAFIDTEELSSETFFLSSSVRTAASGSI